MTRLARAACWALPAVVLLLLYARPGLETWFQQDDFAWLGQRMEVHSWRDLVNVLFTPRAQGTIRTWSERVFFLVLFDRFHLDARPYHFVVWTFQAAAMALLQSIVWRLTRSRIAGLAAPLVWICGIGVATPLTWLSSWNQVLCAFFLLASFRILLQALETDQRRWWVLHWIVFLLGFGALEINLVYPALALAWVFIAAPRQWKKVAPMFLISALYIAAHQLAAAKPKTGVYAMHFDLSIFMTWLRYWGSALAGGMVMPHWRTPQWAWIAAAWLLGIAGAGFGIWAWRGGQRLAAFGAWWFTAVLGPVLPLRDHFSDYYLATASVGLALAWGAVTASAVRSSWGWRAAAVAALGLHLWFCWPVNRATAMWRAERGRRIRALVEGIERAHELHPGKLILLTGLDETLFWSGLYDRPERLFGARVFLAPGAERPIPEHPELGDMTQYVAPPATVSRAMAAGKAAVYAFEEVRLRNITRSYRRQIPAEWSEIRPRWIDAGDEIYQPDLGEGWYANEGGYRWMGRRAKVYLSGPNSAQDRLFLQGYYPAEQLAEPLGVRISVDGSAVAPFSITRANASFDETFELPPGLAGRPAIEVTVEVDRVFRNAGDPRELGLAFGRLGLK
jgi:hypothetical protein